MRKRDLILKLQGWVCVLGLAGIVLACLILITVVARAQSYGSDSAARAARSASPVAAAATSDIYVTYRGKNSSQIYLRTFQAAGAGEWSREWPIPKASSDVAPALCRTDRYLLLVYKGKESDRLIWRTFDGNRWSDERAVGRSKTTAPPSMALWNGTVYLAYRAHPSSQILMRTFNPNSANDWSEEVPVRGAESTAAPVLTVYAGDLLLAYKGVRDDRIYLRGFDGYQWSDAHAVPYAETTLPPAVAAVSDQPALAGQLWVAYQALNSSSVFYVVWDGYRWSKANLVPEVQTSNSPVLISTGQTLFLAYQGLGSNKVYLRQWNPRPWSEERAIPSESSTDVSAARY
jgi:hypothetical protein